MNELAELRERVSRLEKIVQFLCHDVPAERTHHFESTWGAPQGDSIRKEMNELDSSLKVKSW